MYRRNPITGRFVPALTDPAEQFFFAHAGYSHGPDETPLQGRMRCARQLVAAEREAKERGVTFEWSQDDITNRDHTDEGPEYRLWVCVARDATGHIFASVGGVDFGPDYEPGYNGWMGQTHAYQRVIEAELALELPDVQAEPSNN